jgi:hypothetical protein
VKESCGYAKGKNRKNGQVFEEIKQWVLRCPPKKRKKEKEKKIAHDFFPFLLQIQKRENSKEHSRIRLATIKIHSIYMS